MNSMLQFKPGSALKEVNPAGCNLHPDPAPTRVLLINQEKIAHYRVGVYNRLGLYLRQENFALTVVSCGTQPGTATRIQFDHREMRLNFPNLCRLVFDLKPQVVIYWVRLRHLYLFPLLILLKLLGKKVIYWGHGSDLLKGKCLKVRQWANRIEYHVSDALILYGEHQKQYVRGFERKTFIANNTLCFEHAAPRNVNRREVLARYGIRTLRNIICVGRMQKRKRLEDLCAAHKLMNRPDIGVILVGPDTDGVLDALQGEHIYKIAPIYGEERLELMAAADVSCVPGAVGLSIVDAFFCGLPLVTEEGDESAELMYLKDGVNGYVVPRGDVRTLADRLLALLSNEGLREKFSNAARHEIMTNGHIDVMCKGFRDALRHVRPHAKETLAGKPLHPARLWN